MVFFTEDDFQRADYRLLQDGAVSLFWKTATLEEAQDELTQLGYEISEVSCRGAVFAEQMSSALKWMEQFGYSPWGGNLDALNDGMRYYPFGPTKRAVLTMREFDRLVAADSDFAWKILDIIEANARDHLLEGKFLIGLVQTNDNRYTCPPIGGRSVRWNGREWLDRDRGL